MQMAFFSCMFNDMAVVRYYIRSSFERNDSDREWPQLKEP